MIRLNKFLTLCGLGSRRKVEIFITSGRIKINGKTVKNLATTIDTENDIVELDKKKLVPIEKFQYLALNKPKGYITTMDDEKGRLIVMDMIPEKYKRIGVFPIGRLDKDSEGLLLFTNDGSLAQKLLKPIFKIKKEYIVEIDKPLMEHDKLKIETGIFINQINIKTRPAKVEFLDKSNKLIKITIIEGKNRQIRYTFLNLGYKVKKLKRIAYGPISLTGINKGSYRILRKNEIQALKDLIKNA